MNYNDSFYEDYGYGKPTISDEIIAFLLSHRSLSVHRRIIWERLEKRRKKISRKSFHQNIWRLKKRGIIISDDNELELTQVGKSFYKGKAILLPRHLVKKTKMIVIFDIPETKRRSRDWLRLQLRNWDFEMIQKSVWLGYGPFPKEFFEHCSIVGIFECIKIYPVKKQKIT